MKILSTFNTLNTWYCKAACVVKTVKWYLIGCAVSTTIPAV